MDDAMTPPVPRDPAALERLADETLAELDAIVNHKPFADLESIACGRIIVAAFQKVLTEAASALETLGRPSRVGEDDMTALERQLVDARNRLAKAITAMRGGHSATTDEADTALAELDIAIVKTRDALQERETLRAERDQARAEVVQFDRERSEAEAKLAALETALRGLSAGGTGNDAQPCWCHVAGGGFSEPHADYCLQALAALRASRETP